MAVASNFLVPMQEIAAAFELETGNTIHLASGSSGRLYAQIINGAPYHAFFSADQEKPAKLIEEGLGEAGSLFTYATGSIVLWSLEDDTDPYEALINNRISRLAMANPRLAPYGMASMQILESLGLTGVFDNKSVLGENINQAYQFVMTGNADAGFIALSQLSVEYELPAGRGWIVPPNLYDPIRQDAVLLSNENNKSVANDFLDYMRRPEVKDMIERFGYITE